MYFINILSLKMDTITHQSDLFLGIRFEIKDFIDEFDKM